MWRIARLKFIGLSGSTPPRPICSRITNFSSARRASVSGSTSSMQQSGRSGTRTRRIVEGAQIAQGAVFRWTTFGLPLESKINEFVPYTRIGWYGYAPGTTPSAEHSFYHTWFLTPEGDACRVVTDEVGMGKDAAHLRETDESLMHRGHDLWLATLKWVSEGR
jgi:hypothetical protein